MLAGINGAGKTTSIGKLAKYLQSQGKSVLLAAGDTFRAAAREQLQEWGARNNVTVISQASATRPPCASMRWKAAKARGIDIVLADTAGRLPTQLHLMEEIEKSEARAAENHYPTRRTKSLWCSMPISAKTPSTKWWPSMTTLGRHRPDRHQARRHRQRRRARRTRLPAARFPCAISAWAKKSTTCARLTHARLWMRCWIDGRLMWLQKCDRVNDYAFLKHRNQEMG